MHELGVLLSHKNMEVCMIIMLLSFLRIVNVHGHGTGSISLNCGGPPYNDHFRGIDYTSDEGYIVSGIHERIDRKLQKQQKNATRLWSLRSFPEGVRNCYHFKNLGKNDTYMIHAEFFYGNYDGLGKAPQFDILVGSVYKETISFAHPNDLSYTEVIHEIQSSFLPICLLRTTSSNPFISSLELRLIEKGAYNSSGILRPMLRHDLGSSNSNSMDDVYDRHPWERPHNDLWEDVHTTFKVKTSTFMEPDLLMMTAITSKDTNKSIRLISSFPEYANKYIYVYLYFAELIKFRKDNDSREFKIYKLGDEVCVERFSPSFLLSRVELCTFRPSKDPTRTQNATQPPLINAIEIFVYHPFIGEPSDYNDVMAIMQIQREYKLNKSSWQGDPCVPPTYTWEGITCHTRKIKSLDLSSHHLEGSICPDISNLTHLTELDLSNNNLTGTIPDFLSRMAFLKKINLSGNKLIGTIPPLLMEKVNNGSLKLSVENNGELCTSGDCTKKKKTNKVGTILAAIFSILVGICAITLLFIWFKKTTRNDQELPTDPSPLALDNPIVMKREFSYAEIEIITNKFARAIAKGGSGVVYHGVMGGQQVAVKVLDTSSTHAYNQFTSEVGILMRVHHKSLVALNGYCVQGDSLALIYEYMSQGDLKDHLSGKCGHLLSWETRLKIATQIAQGIEYLHYGCNPPVIHRDIKTRNVLLDADLDAKLGDFGLSKACPSDEATHISTVVAGTPGYVDPEYAGNNYLTTKSDVFSYGILLLELITNQSVRDNNRRWPVITDWVSAKFTKGETGEIIDPRLCGEFDTNSMHKIIDIALACTNPTGYDRPSMKRVTLELSECLELEMARTQGGQWSESLVITPR